MSDFPLMPTSNHAALSDASECHSASAQWYMNKLNKHTRAPILTGNDDDGKKQDHSSNRNCHNHGHNRISTDKQQRRG